MAIQQKDDVLAVRRQTLVSEADEHIKILTEYGKDRLAKCKEGRSITPELSQRMKMLVNQEYRIMETCKTVVRVCEDILEECRDVLEVSDEALGPLLQELQEYFSDLEEHNVQRKDNIDRIMLGERESLEQFCMLRSDIDAEKNVVWGLGVGGACALGAAAACPITLVGGLVVAVLVAGNHTRNANQLQKALDEDVKRINAPIQYMETFKKNMDDSVAALERNGGKIGAGRSARLKRRMDMLLEEVHIIRRVACQNFAALAGSETLADGFGFTEKKRMLLVLQDMIKDGIDITMYEQAMR